MSSTAVYRGTPVEDSKPRTVRRRASASSVSSTISIPKQYTPMEDSQPRTVHRQASTSSVSSSTISIPRRYTPPADYDFFCASPPRPTYAQPSYGFSAYRHLSTHSHSFPAHIPTPYPAYGPWDPNQPMQYQPPKVETISSSSRSSPAQDERHNVHFSEEKRGSVPGSWPETPKKKSGCGWNPKTPSPVGSSMLRNAPSSNDAWNKATSFGNSIKGPYPYGRNSPISPSPKVRNDSPKIPVQSSPIFMEESKPSVPSWGACSPKASNQGWDNGVAKSPIPSKPTTPGRASDLPKASDQGWDNSPVKPTTSGWATDSPKASVPGWGNSPAKPTTSEWATDSPKASVRGWGDNPVEPTATGWATDSLKASPTIEAGLGNNSIKSPAPGWVIDSPKTSVQGWGGGPIQSPAPEEATRSPGASGDWRGNSSTKPLASERVTSPQKASVEGWGGSPSPQRRYGVRASHAPPQPSPLKWEAKVASPVPSWNGTGGYPLRVTVHQPVKESESQDSEKGGYRWGTNTTAEGAKDSWGSPAAGGSGNGNWADVSPPLRGTW